MAGNIGTLFGKCAVITGASGQIGYAIAQRFAAKGATVVMCGRDTTRLEEAHSRLMAKLMANAAPEMRKTLLPKCLRTQILDVRSPESWKEAVDSCPEVDILVNCAGVSQSSLLLKTKTEEIDKIIQTNLQGAIYGCKEVTRKLVRNQKEGCIINISSVLASKGVAGTSVYAASKAGLLGLTTSLAAEYGSRSIRVNAIVPGYIESKMTEDVTGDTFRIPLGRFGSPNEVADAAVFLARNRYATNCILNIDGGLSAI